MRHMQNWHVPPFRAEGDSISPASAETRATIEMHKCNGVTNTFCGDSQCPGVPNGIHGHMVPSSPDRSLESESLRRSEFPKTAPSSLISDQSRVFLMRIHLQDQFKCICAVAVALCFLAGTAEADPLEKLTKRLDRIEEENRQLRQEVEALKVAREESPSLPAVTALESTATKFVHMNSTFAYEILDPTTNINRKQRLILDRKRDGTLSPDSLQVHGAITAISNCQSSNRDGKFGYLMRHPTNANHVGDTVSEATIHSAQLGITGTLSDSITGHAEILFDPEQSFGSGTNTALERNQLQMRRAYVLLGNLDRSPFHTSLGKMDVPFGLADTVNPFSASTVRHAFGALANGVSVGYSDNGLNLSVMGVQGGAQFRAANTPVSKTAVPSQLNNYAVDANYRFDLGSATTLLLGGSYLHGSAYCQDFPVVHFGPCKNNNPAFDIYGRLVAGDLTLKGEFARTADAWPGTFNPGIPEFEASRVTSFDMGAKYRYDTVAGPVDLSAEFSRFVAGPDGAPWEHQDQIVLGAALHSRPNAKLFAEYIRIDGYAPLNFISGGSVTDEDGKVIPDATQSDTSAHSDVILIGVNLAF